MVGVDELTVFVAGPGFGEGIALPGEGWILIDGCRVEGQSPTLELWRSERRNPADNVRWVLLTHPHADHVAGFAEVIDQTDPWHIGVAGPNPPAKSLHDELQSWLAQPPAQQQRDALRAAAEAMCTWEHKHRRQVSALNDPAVLANTGQVTVTVRGPTSPDAIALMAPGWPTFRGRANLLSLVVEMEFGANRLVLSGDLPYLVSGTTPPEGWHGLLQRHPHLAAATAWKVSHHGSRDALHPHMVPTTPQPRTTWVTPFTRSGLPRTIPGDGLATLVATSPVLLTAPPVALRYALPASTTVAGLAAALAQGSGPVLGNTTQAPPVHSVIDPVWRSAFDAQGAVTHQRGALALQVT